MAFKYLSCINNDYDSVLKYCHMTLDGYTLNWYNQKFNASVKEWSKIKDYNVYKEIQEKIRSEIENGCSYSIKIGNKETKNIDLPTTPFEAEFIIWEGEIINSKYNDMVKSLNNYKKEGREKDNWLIESIFDNFLSEFVSKSDK